MSGPGAHARRGLFCFCMPAIASGAYRRGTAAPRSRMRSMSNLSGTGADAARATQRAEPQCARAVVMIRPVRFVSNPQTAVTNRFQQIDAAPSEDVAQARALAEFESLVGALTDAGVEVVAFDDTPE